MNSVLFDQISKDLSDRRQLLAALVAVVGGWLAFTQPASGKGKGKGKGKKKNKKKGCATSIACPPGKLCKGGRCRPGCEIHTDCPDGKTCSPHTKQCVQECDYVGYYGPNPNPPLCPAGEVCHGSVLAWCGPSCSSSAPCPGSYMCDPELGACT